MPVQDHFSVYAYLPRDMPVQSLSFSECAKLCPPEISQLKSLGVHSSAHQSKSLSVCPAQVSLSITISAFRIYASSSLSHSVACSAHQRYASSAHQSKSLSVCVQVYTLEICQFKSLSGCPVLPTRITPFPCLAYSVCAKFCPPKTWKPDLHPCRQFFLSVVPALPTGDMPVMPTWDTNL